MRWWLRAATTLAGGGGGRAGGGGRGAATTHPRGSVARTPPLQSPGCPLPPTFPPTHLRGGALPWDTRRVSPLPTLAVFHAPRPGWCSRWRGGRGPKGGWVARRGGGGRGGVFAFAVWVAGGCFTPR
ncbi:hypothetical protein I4F81_010891 [Pyropia yezoensis]|uniref:Uncharacterized protein n=1 Tax=Pyropia yezoensis TaxID=2788 RepID=A0ACC3CE12_PYRYE|nr:hypothetical protein I4F81_010891 [Neopyropia yezoensis]